MNYSILDFLTLLGSVGLFLYGMKVMSEGLQKVAGDRMRNILSAMTKNRFAGVFTGILITALIQSSSASTVMVVSFVNAGLMSLAQSMAVIMGANIGTTFTAWIISIFGFKVNIYAFAIPLIGFAIPMLFSKKSNWKSIGEFLIGFSFLFMGLQHIGLSVPDLKSSPEIFAFLQAYTAKGFLSVLLFILVGMVVTMIIQSSAATFAIVLIMCSKGWIPFDMGCAIVLGSNIGTTITPILAALSANVAAKKAALGHFLFNLFGTIWTIAIFFPFVDLNVWITEALGQGDPTKLMSFSNDLQANNLELYNGIMNGTVASNNPIAIQLVTLQFAVSFGLSMFHTVFNIVNLTIMIWFTDTYVKITNFFIRSKYKEDEEFQLKFISAGLLNASELNITQAQREIAVYGERVDRMWDMVRDLIHAKPGTEAFNNLYSRIEKYEEISDRMEIEIANYLNRASDGRLSYEGKLRIAAMLNIVTEIESIADSCFNIAKTVLRKEEAHAQFNDKIYENIDTMTNYVKEALANMLIILRNIENIHEGDLIKNFNKEREINNYRNLLRTENIENINNKLYEYESGIYYMDIVCEAEKLGDYIINVIEGVEHQFHKRHDTSANVSHA
ncbi:MAG: Na/Pi cotransporter family protein [Muribaculaceae bacterium]|nr:Na/Pi cotransporter family protein [Muribaculaceae bacterium]